MTAVFVILLVAAAVSLGLRSLDGVLARVAHPADRLALALVAGLVWVALVLRVSATLGVFDAGLGLLASLAPVGLFDVTRWWYRSRADLSPWLLGGVGSAWLRGLRWLFLATAAAAALGALAAIGGAPPVPSQ